MSEDTTSISVIVKGFVVLLPRVHRVTGHSAGGLCPHAMYMAVCIEESANLALDLI